VMSISVLPTWCQSGTDNETQDTTMHQNG
jgi:hypothetical protein